MSVDLDIIGICESIRKISGVDRKMPDTMVFAKVTSTEPFEVDVGNGLVLDEAHLFLGQMCRPHKVTLPHTHIIDAHLTEENQSVGNVSETLPSPSVPSVSTQNYSTYKNGGREKEAENGSVGAWKAGTGEDVANALSTKDAVLTAGLSAPNGAVSGTISISDPKHRHIIERQKTLDVHFPHSDEEECVTIEIEPKLKAGDTVLGFFFNNYQMLYVAERVENFGGAK